MSSVPTSTAAPFLGDPTATPPPSGKVPAWNYPTPRKIEHVNDDWLDDCCCVVPQLFVSCMASVVKKIICCDFFPKDKPQ